MHLLESFFIDFDDDKSVQRLANKLFGELVKGTIINTVQAQIKVDNVSLQKDPLKRARALAIEYISPIFASVSSYGSDEVLGFLSKDEEVGVRLFRTLSSRVDCEVVRKAYWGIPSSLPRKPSYIFSRTFPDLMDTVDVWKKENSLETLVESDLKNLLSNNGAIQYGGSQKAAVRYSFPKNGHGVCLYSKLV